ncbi:MAG: hypothetical protein KAY59_09435 [Acidobacteria bacterium]|nr:hypothetical protein [Acidobacteriota bacterium]
MLAVVVCAVSLHASSQERQIDVSGERPLHLAVKEFEKRFGVVVTYEDGPSAGGRFVFTPPLGKADASTALKQMIEDYNRTHPETTFAVEPLNGVFHVYPTSVSDRTNRLVPYRSRLDTPIVVKPGARTGRQLLQAILEAIGAAGGGRLLDVTIAPSPFERVRTSIGFDRVTARQAIMSLASMAGTPVSWQLLCQPGEGEACYFSFTPPGVF